MVISSNHMSFFWLWHALSICFRLITLKIIEVSSISLNNPVTRWPRGLSSTTISLACEYVIGPLDFNLNRLGLSGFMAKFGHSPWQSNFLQKQKNDPSI